MNPEQENNNKNTDSIIPLTQKELYWKRVESAKKRRVEVGQMFEATMGLAMPYDALAKKWNVSTLTIRNDVAKILKDMPKPDMGEYATRVLLGFNNAFKTANNFMLSSDKKDRMEGVRLFNDTVSKNSDFLVKHGFLKKDEESGIFINNTSSLPVKINIIERQSNVQLNQPQIMMFPQEIQVKETSHNDKSPADKTD